MDTTEDQHHADEQIHEWAKVWGAQVSNEPYITVNARDKDTVKWGYYIPPTISREDINRFRRIVASFSKGTATAHDKLPLGIMEHLDDTTLIDLLQLYRRAEHEQKWPTEWLIVTLVMIPKAEAFKWRLIAMLVTPYRIWARIAGEDVSKWMVSPKKD